VIPGVIGVEPIPLHQDHIGLAIFDDRDDNDFRILTSHLSEMVKLAPTMIVEKWEMQRHYEGLLFGY
jgi:hypothetical protein